MKQTRGGKRIGSGRKYRLYTLRLGELVLVAGRLYVIRSVTASGAVLVNLESAESLEIRDHENT